MAKRKQNDELVALVRCPNCRNEYTVTETQINNGEQEFTCPNCGDSIVVQFYTICPKCQGPVGVSFLNENDYNHGMTKGLIGSVAKSIINPMSGLSTAAHYLDSLSAKDNDGDGYCMHCGSRLLVCGCCNHVFQIPKKVKWDATIQCPECGEKINPN